MSWLGAGILGGLGFVMGGPIGAGIGAFIGSTFGKSAAVNDAQKNQTLFFVSLFSMLAKMAKSDGVVVQAEIQAVTDFMHSMRLDEQDRTAAISIFRNAIDDEYSIYDYATQYKGIANVQMREILYGALWKVAHADGVLDEAEDDILRNIPSYLGIHQSIYQTYSTGSNTNTSHSASDLAQYYEVLGCSPDDEDGDIKKAYRRAMREYHPDKIQSKGLPESFLAFANEQSKKINKAYDAIKKTRGLK